MKKAVLFFLVVSVTTFSASSQILLTAGDCCTCPFTVSNLYIFPTGPGSFHPLFGEVQVRLYDTTLPSGTVLRLEMFENGTVEPPICTSFITETNRTPGVGGCNVDNAWQDLQGTVRLTMESGSVTLHSISLQVGRFSGGQYERWMGGVVAIPEPRLSIALLPNAQVELSWATNHIGFALEAAPTLPSGAWTPVSNSIATIGGRFSVVLDITDRQAAFRLRKP